ncbi:MAG TPA: hypothetical protein PK535_09630 [Synergistaceae bacterium]|nr:hypothetical protein [Synergistaceae bacterium]
MIRESSPYPFKVETPSSTPEEDPGPGGVRRDVPTLEPPFDPTGQGPLSDPLAMDPLQAPPERHVLALDSGRSALSVGLRALRRAGCAPVIHLPAVICRAVMTIALHEGFSLRFYRLGRDLATPTFPSPPRAEEVVLYVHYFGWRHDAMERALSSLRRRPFVVEDGASAGLTPGVGGFGDVTVRGFRKLLPITDGALLLSRFPLEDLPGDPDEDFIDRKARELALRRSSPLPPDPFGAEARLDRRPTPRRISDASLEYLASGEWRSAGEERRLSHRRLGALLRGLALPSLEELWELPEGVVPLGFPLLMHRGYGGELRRLLRKEGFPLPMDWGLPPGAPWKEDGDFLRQLVLLPLAPDFFGKEERVMALAARAAGS